MFPNLLPSDRGASTHNITAYHTPAAEMQQSKSNFRDKRRSDSVAFGSPSVHLLNQSAANNPQNFYSGPSVPLKG